MDKQPSEAATEAARRVWSDCCEMGLGDSEIVEQIADALDAARQTALEEACEAVCGRCNRGVKAELRKGVYMHWVRDGLEPKGTEGRWGTCAASAIRALMSEVTP